MGNVSHVMSTLGHATIPGYKPQEHVGTGISERLIEIISRHEVPRVAATS